MLNDDNVCPWLEDDNNPVRIPVTISETLSKSSYIETNNYCRATGEDGNVIYGKIAFEEKDTTLYEEYTAIHSTLKELLQTIPVFLRSIEIKDKKKKEIAKYIISECKNWIQNEVEVIEG